MIVSKCDWCRDGGIMEHYHDTEWGIPCHNDKMLYEYLMMECMSAGLSWKLMLQKRAIFKSCFADFDFTKVAAFTDIYSYLQGIGIINNHWTYCNMFEKIGGIIK